MNIGQCFLSLCIAQSLFAIPVEGIRVKFSTPITPIGGVLMVPLLSETLGDNWPSTLSVTFENGTIVEGRIGWIENNTQISRYWTVTPYTIRQIKPEDDTSKILANDSTTGPVLLAQLPNAKCQQIRIGNDVIEPVWFDIPDALPNVNLAPVNTAAILSPSQKYVYAQSTPLDYWRVTLIASKRGVLPPKTHFNGIEQLAALHSEQLWRIAFDRLATSSRGAAAECRDLLTNTGHDHGIEFACWSTRSESQLLSILLDQSATSKQLASRALRWCANQQPFLFWLESVYGNEITIAIANPTLEVLLVAIKWKEGNDIPIALEVPANETVRIPVARIEHMDLSLFGPTTMESRLEWLELQIGQHLFSIPIVPATVVAHPPNVQLQPLYPYWNLRSIQDQTPSLVQPSQKTMVQLRKLFGKWEFFVSCSGFSKPTHAGSQAVIFYNQRLHDTFPLIPAENTSSASSWSASAPVPAEWIVDGILQFSVTRTHGIPGVREHGPIPTVPWTTKHPAQIVVDLSKWDTIEKFPSIR